MRKGILYGAATLLLIVLCALVVWQGSFSFGEYAPASPEQTYTVWAVSTLIFVLTVTLGFMLVRNFVKLYIERRSNRLGSRIRSKLVVGAVALTAAPVFFAALFSVYVLNRNLEKWFTRPAENIKLDFVAITDAIAREFRGRGEAEASLAAANPLVQQAAADGAVPAEARRICAQRGIQGIRILRAGHPAIRICGQGGGAAHAFTASVGSTGATLEASVAMQIDAAEMRARLEREVRDYDQLAVEKKQIRRNYLQLLLLITLFVVFFGTWIALFLARLISVPISALLGGAQQVREGNLSYRVDVNAIDELATLVRAFNEMTAGLEANRRELENRRRFTEAILESIPTGVLSVAADGRIQRINRALKGLLPPERIEHAQRVDDLFAPEDARELRYLTNRARRVGISASQFEVTGADGKRVPLSVTVAAIDERAPTSGYVVVLEDTSDLLRAQKFAAWHEIARRIAHEIKNPLTPIALCAERIVRQLDRRGSGPDTDGVVRECATIIDAEVESLRRLVDEFSQFARFPAARPVRANLNEAVENALAVFHGRLEGIDVQKRLAPDLPAVNIDPDQFKRLLINLVDNAAEAMQNSPVKQLTLTTSSPAPDTVELEVADTGPGVSQDDKDKLFLPYFSTKGRGTGLGLAIVNHIVADHNAHIRVEENKPAGARFIVEIPAAVEEPAEVKA